MDFFVDTKWEIIPYRINEIR